jgi:hypothetical protein
MEIICEDKKLTRRSRENENHGQKEFVFQVYHQCDMNNFFADLLFGNGQLMIFDRYRKTL